MFGFPRLKALLKQCPGGPLDPSTTADSTQSTEGNSDSTTLIACVLSALRGFTDEDWEQKADVTLVALHRLD